MALRLNKRIDFFRAKKNKTVENNGNFNNKHTKYAYMIEGNDETLRDIARQIQKELEQEKHL